jgi:hypothetical protein
MENATQNPARNGHSARAIFISWSTLLLIVLGHSAHITARLEGSSSRAHPFQHNKAEAAMDSMDSHSTEKPNFARSGAAMLT